MRQNRRARRSLDLHPNASHKRHFRRLLHETLEDRQLLSGVTLITHGFASGVNKWLDHMADAIAERAGGASQVSQYTMIVEGGLDGQIGVTSFPGDSGSPPWTDTSSGDAIIKVDWSDIDSLGERFSTTRVAESISSYLFASPYIDGVHVFESPIHLIGHSRGASLMGALAEDLSAKGVWVDQVTFLDTHPLPAGIWEPEDWGRKSFEVPGNVVFADSYWRADGYDLDYDGRSVLGALNAPLKFGADEINDLIWPLDAGYLFEHSDVHLWYHGTIVNEGEIDDGSVAGFDPDAAGWYYDSGNPSRTGSGYNFSRIGGRVRDSNGVAKSVGGLIDRPSALYSNSAAWPNVLNLALRTGARQFTIGDPIPVAYYYQDHDSSTTVNFYFDEDTNPYNDNGVGCLTDQRPGLAKTDVPVRRGSDSVRTSSVQGRVAYSKDYFLVAKIWDADGHTRYAYVQDPITFTEPSQRSDISIYDTPWDDFNGYSDRDGVVEGHEQGDLRIRLKSAVAVQDVSATLVSTASGVDIEDSHNYYGAMSAGGLSYGDGGYAVQFNLDSYPDCPFTLQVQYRFGGVWYYQDILFTKTVYPQANYASFAVVDYRFEDPATIWFRNDNDRRFETGERTYLWPTIQNTGSVTAHNVQGRLVYSGSGLSVCDRWRYFPDLAPGQRAENLDGALHFWINDDNLTLSGPFTVHLEVKCEETGMTPVLLPEPMTLVVDPAPVLSVEPRETDFGRVAPGVAVHSSTRVVNRGTAPLTIEGIGSLPGDTAVPASDFPFAVEAGASWEIPVTIDTAAISDGTRITRELVVRTPSGTRLFEPPDNPPPSDRLTLSGLVQNAIPVLTHVDTLTGAMMNEAFVISYAALASAANESDPDSQQNLRFRIESVTSGTLSKDGASVVPGQTLLGPCDYLVWQPPADVAGVVDAFTVKVWDGLAVSTEPVQVKVEVAQPGEIHGLKWNDQDGNGIRDTDEPGLQDWQVYLDLNKDGVREDGEPAALTAQDGSYSFTGLRPGTYAVAEEARSRWAQTAPSSTETPLLTLGSPTSSDWDDFSYTATVGSNVLVGASSDVTDGLNTGIAYLLDGDSGEPLTTFHNPTPDFDDRFGVPGAALGNDVVIGAYYADDAGPNNSGTAYVFDSGTGDLLATLYSPNPVADEEFGVRVATLGDLIIVSARGYENYAGIVYVFRWDGSNATHVATLHNPTPAGNEHFGMDLAATSNRIVVGACLADGNLGAAYVFDSSAFSLLYTIENPSPGADDYFGARIATFGDDVLVGAPYDDTDGSDAGIAYLFDGDGGQLVQTFHNPAPPGGVFGGGALAAVGNRVLIGAQCSSADGASGGIAYLFDAVTGKVLQVYYNPGGGSEFGSGGGVLGNQILIAARFGSANTGGAIYKYWGAGDGTSPGSHMVTLSSGQVAADINFGNHDVHAVVIDRHVFYNHSAWDGGNGDANAADDGAIATDKHALLNGQQATFANYTSYSRGINGIMIDIADLAAPTLLSVADFEFRTGNNNTPAGWSVLALDPSLITVAVRPGEGADGSDRVTLLFPDGAVKKTWLQVTVKATDATGLAAPDVHYWGNAVGDSGDSTGNTAVNVVDALGVRANPHTLLKPAPIDDAYDYNRDKQVNVQDELIVRANPTTQLTDLNLIDLSGSGGGGEGEGEWSGGVWTMWTDGSILESNVPLHTSGARESLVVPFTASSDLPLPALRSVAPPARLTATILTVPSFGEDLLPRDAVDSLLTLPVAPSAMPVSRTAEVPDRNHRTDWVLDRNGSSQQRTLDEALQELLAEWEQH